MAIGLSGRLLARRFLTGRLVAMGGAGLLLPDLTALAGFGKSIPTDMLPDVGRNLAETVPQPVPEFHFLDASGRRLTLAHYRGTGLVVNIWATWCPPCRAELPSLVALNRRVRQAGIRVLPISVDEQGIQAVAPYYRRHGIKGVPMLSDPHSSALRAFRVSGIPLTVIVNRKTEMVAMLEGAGNWDSAGTAAKVIRLIGPAQGVVAKPPATTAT